MVRIDGLFITMRRPSLLIALSRAMVVCGMVFAQVQSVLAGNSPHASGVVAQAAEVTPPARPTATIRRPGAISASFELGTDPGDDLALRIRTRLFAPHDTIFVSVSTDVEDGGVAPATMEAVFTYETDGEPILVSRQSSDLTLSSAGLTNFQISKPDGFPEGGYRAEVRINNVVIGAMSFKVGR